MHRCDLYVNIHRKIILYLRKIYNKNIALIYMIYIERDRLLVAKENIIRENYCSYIISDNTPLKFNVVNI